MLQPRREGHLAGARRAEGHPGCVRRRDHVGARRPLGRDVRLPDDAAPRLLAPRRAHLRLQPAQADRQELLQHHDDAPPVHQPEQRAEGAAHLGRGAGDHPGEQGSPRRDARLRPRLRVRLLWLQDAREVVPAARQGRGGRAAAADADARVDRHPHDRHRPGGRDVPPHVAEVVHARDADDVQRRRCSRRRRRCRRTSCSR